MTNYYRNVTDQWLEPSEPLKAAASGNLIWGEGTIAAFNIGAVIDWRTMCAAVGLSTLTQFMSLRNHHLHDLTGNNRSKMQ